jgi:hypothetical protein
MSNNLRSIERAKKREQDKAATMTVTVGDLVAARPVLNELVRAKFPEGKGKLSLSFGRLCRDVFKELDTAYDPAYNELLKKHGEEDQTKPGTFQIPQAEVEKFQAAVKELISAEIVLVHQPLPELVDIFSLSAAEALMLEWLIDRS